MEGFYALIGMYIKKNSPFQFVEVFDNNKKTKKFILPNNKLTFTLYELKEYMNIKGGSYHEKLKRAISSLKSTEIFSLEKEGLFDRSNNEYIVTAACWLNSYKHSIKKSQKSESDMSSITFGELILSNIQNDYVNFLDPELFFQLRSGLTRRLYSYLRGSIKKKTKFIKRYLDTLNDTLPLECKYNCNIKNKLKPHLNALLEKGIISNYFYGDEFLVNFFF